MIVKVRLGSEKEHEEWDSREELRPMIEEAVKLVLGGEDHLEPLDPFVSEELLFSLLCEDVVFKALSGGEIGKLTKLIKQKKETFLTRNEKREML